ncbi:MAG: RsmE family RNA methyltransferase [Chloroflexota bacterium]
MGDAGGEATRLTVPRFFVNRSAVTAESIRFEPDQAHQIRRVLRLRMGDRVVVCDGSGDEIIAVLQVEGKYVWARPLERRPGRGRPYRTVRLYQSALRGDRFAWLLQKATEVGVAGIVPLRYHFTQQADYGARHGRYLAILREAAEQCERSILPDLATPMLFADALLQCKPERETCLLLDEQETEQSFNLALRGSAGTVRLFVGPEGGITDDERTLAHRRGLSSVSLGRSILRSETAGLVAVVLALGAAGDLG